MWKRFLLIHHNPGRSQVRRMLKEAITNKILSVFVFFFGELNILQTYIYFFFLSGSIVMINEMWSVLGGLNWKRFDFIKLHEAIYVRSNDFFRPHSRMALFGENSGTVWKLWFPFDKNTVFLENQEGSMYDAIYIYPYLISRSTKCTFPTTNSSPVNIGLLHQKEGFVLQPLIFRCERR